MLAWFIHRPCSCSSSKSSQHESRWSAKDSYHLLAKCLVLSSRHMRVYNLQPVPSQNKPPDILARETARSNRGSISWQRGASDTIAKNSGNSCWPHFTAGNAARVCGQMSWRPLTLPWPKFTPATSVLCIQSMVLSRVCQYDSLHLHHRFGSKISK